MNLWYSLIVSASLWLSGGEAQYAPPEWIDASNLISTEIGATIGYGPIFGYTSVITTMFPEDGRMSFSPQDNTYVIGGGLTIGPVTLGIEHECWHPMVAYQWVPSRSQIIPNYEGGGTRAYVKIVIESPKR